LRAARANRVFCTEKTSVQKTRLWIKTGTPWGFYTRSPIAHGRFLIRAKSAIRADGFSSAQQRNTATTVGAI
jgi:hypothetical protein